jgi:hypothetical protein
MQTTNDQELIAARKLPHLEAIDVLKAQLSEANHRARALAHRCAVLEMQLMREGWTVADFSTLYSES